MRKAFTLIELLVVIAIISLLLALSLPAMRRVREQGRETVCRSSLRQMAVMLKTYTNNNDSLFPWPSSIYHSPASYYPSDKTLKPYLACCRWHDARIGLDSDLLRHSRPELRGSLWPYLKDTRIARCRAGVLANLKRGCNNGCCGCVHNPSISVVPQYTYTMNAYLGSTIMTGLLETGPTSGIDKRTVRTADVRKDTQVTRSPSLVFAFGEENSWAINREGRQPLGAKPEWAAPYDLSGKYYIENCPDAIGEHGTIGLPDLNVHATYFLLGGTRLLGGPPLFGDAFATCHRPLKGDLNTGHSYVAMLDEHVEKVTVADQLRRSRRVEGMKESRLGPGGNVALSWPLDVPPPGGWDNQ
jgi:prepilin-type N-terminal cleavage/methylation domain-containing protein